MTMDQYSQVTKYINTGQCAKNLRIQYNVQH